MGGLSISATYFFGEAFLRPFTFTGDAEHVKPVKLDTSAKSLAIGNPAGSIKLLTKTTGISAKRTA